jgi:hypothetical protein
MGVDGRSPAARRFRDLVHAYEAEFEVTTELDRGLIRQVALLTLKSEQLQAAVVNGDAVDTDILTNLSGQIRRSLKDLRRKAAESAPAPTSSLIEHLAASSDANDEDDGGDA